MLPLSPSSLWMRWANSLLDSRISPSCSIYFLRLRWCCRAAVGVAFCRESSNRQGMLTSQQQLFILVSPNSLYSTYSPDSSLKAQPTEWYSSSMKWAVLTMHSSMRMGLRHSKHSNFMKSRSPLSMRDMMVSSAWKPQLIPNDSLVRREASLRVSALMLSRQRCWLWRARQERQPQPTAEKRAEAASKSRAPLSSLYIILR